MEQQRVKIWLIIILTAAAVFIDLPRRVVVAPLKIDFVRPTADINLLGFRFFRDLEIKKGLDLAGGTQLTLAADMKDISPSDRKEALESLKSIIERRVNLYGVFEPVVQTARSGEDWRVVVELAGVTDLEQAKNLIGQTAQLTFNEEKIASPAGESEPIANLSGKDLLKANPSFDPNTGEPIIQLTFNDAGAKKWEEATKRNLNKRIAILLDGQILIAPVVKGVIPNGQAVISGGFTAQQTKQIATLLNSGALPTPVKVIAQRTIGATLGQDSIDKSLVAGGAGLGAVALFMIIRYRWLGLFADLALVIYSLLVLAIFKLVPVTLTLAGIAGFILSIGMAVDANILTFERMREEILWGRKKLAALELGFTRAFPSIRDSNASSLITCTILYWFGSGPVRGFALTLAIGVVVSLFTAITVTRTVLRIFVKND